MPRMDNPDLRNAIYENLQSLRSGTLAFWGNWFGKPHDNVHRIVGAEFIEGSTIIYFDHAESLIIDAPENWSLSDGQLIIRQAKRVRFQWFYYGQEPSREALQFEEYRWTEDSPSFATSFQPGRLPNMSANAPAVQIHSFGK